MVTQVAPARPSRGLAAAVLRAQAILKEVRTAEGLHRAAVEIADAAALTGCTALVPASASSQGAVAAAVMLSGGELTEAGDGDVLQGRADKVLVVEVAAITGLHVRRRVATLRESGAEWIGAIVLHDLSAEPRTPGDALRFGPVDDLV